MNEQGSGNRFQQADNLASVSASDRERDRGRGGERERQQSRWDPDCLNYSHDQRVS